MFRGVIGIKCLLYILLPLAVTSCSLWCNSPYQDDVKREEALAATDVWHAAKLRGVEFRAIGQEPSWLLEIMAGQEIVLVTAYGENRQVFPYVQPRQDKAIRRSRFQLKGATIELEGKRCIDIMSGEVFEAQVTITLSDSVLKGCGRALH